MTTLTHRADDLFVNASTRLPIALVLDCSWSMSGDVRRGAAPLTRGEPIADLNRGVRSFFDAIDDDDDARYAAEVAIVSFAGDAQLDRDFAHLRGDAPPQLECRGRGTSLGAGVELALQHLEARKDRYKSTGVEYYQPWMVIMTDGRPTDEAHRQLAPDLRARIAARKLMVLPIAIGGLADQRALQLLTGMAPQQLDNTQFADFFTWLSASAVAVSRGVVNDGVSFDDLLASARPWSMS